MLQGPQGEGTGAPGDVEEPGERLPVQEGDPIGEQGADVAGAAGLPLAGVQFTGLAVGTGRVQRVAQRGVAGGAAVEQFAQLGDGG